MTDISLEVLVERVNHVVKTVDEMKKLLEEGYVTKAEFEPVRRIVFGGAAAGLLAVAYALLKLVGLK